jgi:surfactin synthase thioesterase subunit
MPSTSSGVFSSVLLVVAGCAHSRVQHAERDLRTTDGFECHAYLASEHQPVTDVILSMGGTGTGSSAFIPEAIEPVLHQRAAAFITFDKPGVRARMGDPGSARIDDEAFRRHTQGTLLQCARQALANYGPEVRWHFRGHSEGALIALNLFEQLTREAPTTARRVKTLILSGLPLEPLEQIVHRQLASLPELSGAVDRCDWPVMKKQMGISCAYLEDLRTRPSGFTLFEKIAVQSPAVAIRVFQGNRDQHTPASFVRGLEEWNAATGHLDLQVHYYDGDHHGSADVRRELTQAMLPAVSSDQ